MRVLSGDAEAGIRSHGEKDAPEIAEIVDATDHAAGKKPFYPHAGQAR